MDNYTYRIKQISLYMTPSFSRNLLHFYWRVEKKGDVLVYMLRFKYIIHDLFKKY